jgi:hypothetical protein
MLNDAGANNSGQLFRALLQSKTVEVLRLKVCARRASALHLARTHFDVAPFGLAADPDCQLRQTR